MEVTREEIVKRLESLEYQERAIKTEIEATAAKLHAHDQQNSAWHTGDRVRYTAAAYYRADRGKAYVITKISYNRYNGVVETVWGVPLKKDGTQSMRQPRYLYDLDHLVLVP